MKKRSCILLVLAILFMSATAFIEASETPPAPEIPLNEKKDYSSAITVPESIKAGDGQSKFPTPNVTLKIDKDGRYYLVSEGIEISLDFPFGWYVFTQDYLTQLNLYLGFKIDINAFVTSLQEEEQLFHALSGEFDTGYCQLFLSQTPMSSFANNLSKLDAVLKNAVLAMYKEESPQGEVKLLQTASNEFISVRMPGRGCEVLFCDTFYNGLTLRLIVFSDSTTLTQQEIDDFMLILESMKIQKA